MLENIKTVMAENELHFGSQKLAISDVEKTLEKNGWRKMNMNLKFKAKKLSLNDAEAMLEKAGWVASK